MIPWRLDMIERTTTDVPVVFERLPVSVDALVRTMDVADESRRTHPPHLAVGSAGPAAVPPPLVIVRPILVVVVVSGHRARQTHHQHHLRERVQVCCHVVSSVNSERSIVDLYPR